LREAYAQLLLAMQDRDVLVAAGGAMLHPAILDQITQTKLLICADDPENSDNLSRPIAAHFDHCFVVNAAHVADYATWGSKSASWLPPSRVCAGAAHAAHAWHSCECRDAARCAEGGGRGRTV
jgi:hypothetical protein